MLWQFNNKIFNDGIIIINGLTEICKLFDMEMDFSVGSDNCIVAVMKIGINSGYIYISVSVRAFMAIEVCSVRFLKKKISGGEANFFSCFRGYRLFR